MGEKYKMTCNYFNCVEHFHILAWIIASCVSTSAFASLFCVPVGITSSPVGIKLCAITARIKKYKPIIKKKRKEKNNDKIVLLGKDELSTIDVVFSNNLINSYISHGKIFSANNVLREYNDIKEEILIFLWDRLYKYGW